MPRGGIKMEKKKRPGGSRYVKKPGLAAKRRAAERRAAERRAAERRAAVTMRMQAADDYILGARTMEELATAHGVVVGTIRDWVQARKRMTKPRRDPVAVEQRFERHSSFKVYDIMQGSGGRMRDDEVRDATRALEVAIVALQAKLGLRTFPYRQRSDGGW
jgi:transposase-like protein